MDPPIFRFSSVNRCGYQVHRRSNLVMLLIVSVQFDLFAHSFRRRCADLCRGLGGPASKQRRPFVASAAALAFAIIIVSRTERQSGGGALPTRLDPIMGFGQLELWKQCRRLNPRAMLDSRTSSSRLRDAVWVVSYPSPLGTCCPLQPRSQHRGRRRSAGRVRRMVICPQLRMSLLNRPLSPGAALAQNARRRHSRRS
jgi:hypothetical protein